MSPSIAQPSGANVVAGQAAISAPNAATTLITQSSQKAIINWQSFSVAGGGLVQFAQPNASAITLNRVTGGAPSAIDGAIRANGQVWLINPNGVLFGQGAQINVRSLLATTSDVADGDFLSGNYSFAGSSNAAVVNNGTIHARKGGSVVLSGASVANGGLIEARAGHVVLGAADAFTVDFTGDHLLSYAVTQPVARQTTDAGGNPQSASVTNSGIIRAAGGKVLMTARAAANIADGVVNNSGMVEATSARVENGEIILDAGDGNAISSGTLNASGKKAGETGGSVEVLGQTVTIAEGAKIDVSGDAGGGQALIGGNFHGAGPQANAQTTVVGKAVINANAIHTGNGGKVAVWSNGRTSFAGAISARGGAQSGNGGQVETSGHALGIAPGASVDASAINGAAGNWLLDPTNITISSSDPSPGSDVQGTLTAGALASSTDAGQDDYVTPATIQNALFGTNGTDGTSVTLAATNNITVVSSVAPTMYLGTSVPQLTLNANGTIAVNASFLLGNYPLNLNAGGAITQSASISAGSLTASSSSGSIVLTNAANAITGPVSLTASGDIAFSNSVATTINRANNGQNSLGNELPADNIDLEVADPGGTASPGIFVNGNSLSDSIDALGTVVLHAAGAITSAANPIIANTIKLVSDTAGIGTLANPMQVTASVLTATSRNHDIVIAAKPQNIILTIGDGTTGINAGTGNVALIAGSAQISATSSSHGIITANNLRISSASAALYDVEVRTLNASTNNGSLSIATNAGFQLSNITGAPGAAAISAGTGSVMLVAKGSGGITQNSGASGRIVAGNFEADATGAGSQVSLTNAGNLVSGTLNLTAAGSAAFFNNTSTLAGTSTATNALQIQSAGNLTINAGATLTSAATGDAVILAAGGNFINNAGSGAVVLTGSGSFAIYSTTPGSDVFGNLNSDNMAVWNGSFPGGVGSATGNRYIFSVKPILTVTAGDLFKTYGTDASGVVAPDYTISGLQAGVVGAFLGDSAASVYSGMPSVTTSGGAANANVANYSINVASGSLTLLNSRYGLSLQSGVLTVNPATLTYNANSASSVAGTAIPSLSGTVTGFANGETLGSATAGTLVFTTSATTASTAGSYAISGGGLTASNYVFVQAVGNGTALVITAAPATVTVIPVTSTGTGGPSIATLSLLSFTASQPLNQPGTFLAALSQAPEDQTAVTTGQSSFGNVTTTTTALTLTPVTNPIQDMVANSSNGSGDPPSSSDVATNYIVQSLDGGSAPAKNGAPVVISGLLHTPSGTVLGGGGVVSSNDLSAWGNTALWQ